MIRSDKAAPERAISSDLTHESVYVIISVGADWRRVVPHLFLTEYLVEAVCAGDMVSHQRTRAGRVASYDRLVDLFVLLDREAFGTADRDEVPLEAREPIEHSAGDGSDQRIAGHVGDLAVESHVRCNETGRIAARLL